MPFILLDSNNEGDIFFSFAIINSHIQHSAKHMTGRLNSQDTYPLKPVNHGTTFSQKRR